MDPDDSTSEGDEARLVERIRSGDQDAEGDLYRRYQRGIFIFLRRKGIPEDTAEDILQDAITIVIQAIKAGKLRDPSRLSGFVLGVVKHLLLTYHRKQSRVVQVTEAHERIPVPPTQYNVLERKQDAQNVRRVIQELKSQRDRQVLIRYYLEDESKEKICQDLGISSTHFSSVLYRAHKRFRDLFEKKHPKTGISDEPAGHT